MITQATCTSGGPPNVVAGYNQWATGGPPDVAISTGPPDVALEVGKRMLACGCNADADIKWLSVCTHPVVHRMRHIRCTTRGTCACYIRWSTSGLLVDHRMCKSLVYTSCILSFSIV